MFWCVIHARVSLFKGFSNGLGLFKSRHELRIIKFCDWRQFQRDCRRNWSKFVGRQWPWPSHTSRASKLYLWSTGWWTSEDSRVITPSFTLQIQVHRFWLLYHLTHTMNGNQQWPFAEQSSLTLGSRKNLISCVKISRSVRLVRARIDRILNPYSESKSREIADLDLNP
jgi:hypothetical protein